MRFQLHTLQLLPEGGNVPAMPERLWKSWRDWTAACRYGMRGASSRPRRPPSPVFLRNGHGASASVPVPTSGAHGLGERWTAAPQAGREQGLIIQIPSPHFLGEQKSLV